MLEESQGWIVAKEVCRICSHWGIAVVPLEADMDTLQCANCLNMASEVAEIYDK